MFVFEETEDDVREERVVGGEGGARDILDVDDDASSGLRASERNKERAQVSERTERARPTRPKATLPSSRL